MSYLKISYNKNILLMIKLDWYLFKLKNCRICILLLKVQISCFFKSSHCIVKYLRFPFSLFILSKKNISNLVSPNLKLHSRYCHILHQQKVIVGTNYPPGPPDPSAPETDHQHFLCIGIVTLANFITR
jgi:hypothetical protein